MRNPKWSEDEEILLVDLYCELMKQNKDITHSTQELKELSDLLRSHAVKSGVEISETYRNLNGLIMKCHNLSSIIDGKGLGHTSTKAQSVINMMLNNPQILHNKAEQIRREWGIVDK